jgi:CheY-like chemotaxis protein
MTSSTILIAEAYEDDELLTRRTLARYGIINDVVVARSGPEVLSLLAGGLRPLALLLEPALPLVAGAEIVGRMQADPALSSIPVILMTSGDEPPNGTPLPQNHGTVAKPIAFDPLVAAMGRCGLRLADGSSRTGAWVRQFLPARRT